MPKEDTFEYVNERINKIAEQVDAIDRKFYHELSMLMIRLRPLEMAIDNLSKTHSEIDFELKPQDYYRESHHLATGSNEY